MKNVLKLLKKSFIGIPIAIFLYEMFNLTVSIMAKQYVKIDGFSLERLMYDYIFGGMIGYAYFFIINYIDYNIKNSEKNLINKCESVVIFVGTVIMLLILFISIIEKQIGFGLLFIAMILLLILALLFIIFLFDKRKISDINNKIREKKD